MYKITVRRGEEVSIPPTELKRGEFGIVVKSTSICDIGRVVMLCSFPMSEDFLSFLDRGTYSKNLCEYRVRRLLPGEELVIKVEED